MYKSTDVCVIEHSERMPAARPRKELPIAAMACCIHASPVPRITTCTFCAAAPIDTPSSHVLSSFAMSLSAP